MTKNNFLSQLNTQFTKGKLIFSTKLESANETTEGTFFGFMQFVTDTKNWCRTLNFYIPTTAKVTGATLHTKYLDYLATGASQRAEDINIYLNPTKTKVSPMGAANDYYVYSGSDVIRNSFNPSTDEQITEDIFSNTFTSKIKPGWNRIVAQCETSDPTDLKRGYLTMILVLDLVFRGTK
jgi:hypothetical protein